MFTFNIMEYIFLLIGFGILLYSGKFLVKGGVLLGNRYRISTLVIGVTIVSFGTSAPELFVSLTSAIKGYPEIAIGNVIGSNIANIALVLAVTAIIFPIPVKKNSVKTDTPFMLLISLLLYLFILNHNLGVFEGIIFVVGLIAYIVFSIYFSKKNNDYIDKHLHSKQPHWSIIVLMILGSALGLALGSNLLVKNAEIIARDMGVSDRVIAISIVALGTSLPELATSAIAAFRKEMDISIGNIIGSNIFNILGVLGITSIVKPIPIDNYFIHVDIFWMLGISVLLFLFILPFQGGKITRIKGLILFMVYAVYIYLLFKK